MDMTQEWCSYNKPYKSDWGWSETSFYNCDKSKFLMTNTAVTDRRTKTDSLYTVLQAATCYMMLYDYQLYVTLSSYKLQDYQCKGITLQVWTQWYKHISYWINQLHIYMIWGQQLILRSQVQVSVESSTPNISHPASSVVNTLDSQLRGPAQAYKMICSNQINHNSFLHVVLFLPTVRSRKSLDLC